MADMNIKIIKIEIINIEIEIIKIEGEDEEVH